MNYQAVDTDRGIVQATVSERYAHQPASDYAQAVYGAGGMSSPPGLFDGAGQLPGNLPLTGNERFEPHRHPKDVAGGLVAGEGIESQFPGIFMRQARHKGPDQLGGPRRLWSGDYYFVPVAGVEVDQAVHLCAATQLGEKFSSLFVRQHQTGTQGTAGQAEITTHQG